MMDTLNDDTELKAILMRDGVMASIEKVRRKLFVLDKRSEIYFKRHSKLRCLENVEIALEAENRSLRDKLSLHNKKLLDLTGEDALDCITSESENYKNDFRCPMLVAKHAHPKMNLFLKH
jgi:hypothetical protein